MTMTTDYDALVDGAAIAHANERHRQVQLRLEAARRDLVTAEAARDAAKSAHDFALGEGGDARASAKALASAEADLKLAQDTVPAVQAAVERSAITLRGEVAKAHRPVRDAAASDLLRAARDMDGLRQQLAETLARYRNAAVALGRAAERGAAAPSVNAVPAHADGVREWASLPADRAVLPTLLHRFRGSGGECAAVADRFAAEAA